MSDTPRTEAEVARLKGPTDDIVTVDANFACELERELAAANQRIKRLEKELFECNAHRERLIVSAMEAWGRIDEQEGSR